MDWATAGYIAGVVTVALLIAGLIYKAGKVEERLTGKIGSVSEDVGAVQKQIQDLDIKRQETLKIVDAHVQQPGIHVIPHLEERIYAEQAAWRQALQSKVDKMYDMLLSRQSGG